MRKLAVTSAILAAVFSGNGCAKRECGKPRPEAHVPGRANHVVLCWLKEPGNESHRRRIVEVSTTFREIPGVVEVRAGEVVPSERAIVDDSFDVAIFLTFASERDMKAYVEHPRHRAAVKDVLLPLVEKVTVYDFVE